MPWCDNALLRSARLAAAVPKRRIEFLAGRRCAHAALLGLGHQPVVPVPRAPDGAPVWPPGMAGTISHGAGWAAALVSHDPRCAGLGVDIEACLADDAWAELTPQFLLPRERRLLRPGQAGLIATLCFSLKECLMKALLPRLRAPLDFLAIEVLTLDHSRRLATLDLPSAARSALGAGCTIQAQWSPWPLTETSAVITALQLRSPSVDHDPIA